MHAPLRRALVAVLLAAPLAGWAQVVPTTPTKFTTRATGNLSEGSGTASLNAATPKSSSITRHVSYLVLSPARAFTSNDGKTLVGKLIAWEQTVVEVETGKPLPEAQAPALNGPPTVLRADQVRLLIGQKAYELPLKRLSPEDQAFIKDLDQRLHPAPSPATATGAAKP
ncbi:MAG: hypothetical protein KDK99_08610 [Verrucomicrobiales bacterium]|nr:hypothetical protein [Verrucomicrobiales bacterium]